MLLLKYIPYVTTVVPRRLCQTMAKETNTKVHIILVFSTTFGAANLKKKPTFNVLLFKFMIIIIFGCMLFPGVLKSHGA